MKIDSTQYTAHTTPSHSQHHTLHTIHYTVHTTHTSHTTQHTPHNIHYTPHTTQYTPHLHSTYHTPPKNFTSFNFKKHFTKSKKSKTHMNFITVDLHQNNPVDEQNSRQKRHKNNTFSMNLIKKAPQHKINFHVFVWCVQCVVCGVCCVLCVV